ncbi:MAG: AraC family transcriptional regulator, partial [Ruminococcus sp.]
MTKIETEWQNAEQERQEDFIQHEPPEVEFVFYNQVQQGDVASVEKNLKSGQYRHIAMKTRLSTDLVQNFRYHCIISLAMVTRFCIEGGMPGEQAYRMSDFYIHKVDEVTTIDLVEELHDAACMDYAKRMQQIKNKPVCSKPVTLCL